MKNSVRIHLMQFSIVALSIIIFFNLNASFTYLFNLERFASPLIIFLCFIILLKTMDFQLLRSHPLMSFYFLFIVLYLCIGLAVGNFFMEYLHMKANRLNIITSVVSGLIITITYYAFIQYAHFKNRLNGFFEFMFWILFIASICVIVFNYFGIQVTAIELGDRKAGLFANPNEAGFISSLLLALSLYQLSRKSIPSMICFLGFFTAILTGLMTLSKSAAVIIFAILFFYLIYFTFKINHISQMQRRVIFLFYMIFGSLILIVIINWSNYLGLLSYSQLSRLEELFNLASGNIDSNVASNRDILIKEGMGLINKNPVFGYGLGTFSRLKHVGLGVHNTFILIWGEAGLFILLIFTILFLSLVFKIFQLPSILDRFLLASFWLILLGQSFLVSHNAFDFRVGNAIIGICFGIISIYSFPNKQRNAET